MNFTFFLAGSALLLSAEPSGLLSQPLSPPKRVDSLALTLEPRPQVLYATEKSPLTLSAGQAAKEEMVDIYRKLLTATCQDEMSALFDLFYERLYAYLNEAPEATFLPELRANSEWIEAIMKRYHRFIYRTLPYRFSQSYPLACSLSEKNTKLSSITTTYCMSRPLTEKEKLELYLSEIASYRSWPHLKILHGSALAVHALQAGSICDFVITSQGELLYALQREVSRIELKTDSPLCLYRLSSPSHSLLTREGDRAQCIGSFTLWSVGEKALFFAWEGSGGAAGSQTTLAPLKKALMDRGIDEAQILLIPLCGGQELFHPKN